MDAERSVSERLFENGDELLASLRLLLAEATDEIDRLREALMVYADERNWESLNTYDPHVPLSNRVVWNISDYGPAIARAALGED